MTQKKEQISFFGKMDEMRLSENDPNKSTIRTCLFVLTLQKGKKQTTHLKQKKTK